MGEPGNICPAESRMTFDQWLIAVSLSYWPYFTHKPPDQKKPYKILNFKSVAMMEGNFWRSGDGRIYFTCGRNENNYAREWIVVDCKKIPNSSPFPVSMNSVIQLYSEPPCDFKAYKTLACTPACSHLPSPWEDASASLPERLRRVWYRAKPSQPIARWSTDDSVPSLRASWFSRHVSKTSWDQKHLPEISELQTP